VQSKTGKNQLNLLHGTKMNQICSEEMVNSQESVVSPGEWVCGRKDLSKTFSRSERVKELRMMRMVNLWREPK